MDEKKVAKDLIRIAKVIECSAAPPLAVLKKIDFASGADEKGHYWEITTITMQNAREDFEGTKTFSARARLRINELAELVELFQVELNRLAKAYGTKMRSIESPRDWGHCKSCEMEIHLPEAKNGLCLGCWARLGGHEATP